MLGLISLTPSHIHNILSEIGHGARSRASRMVAEQMVAHADEERRRREGCEKMGPGHT